MEKNLSTLTQSQQQFVSDAHSRFGRTTLTHKDHATMLSEGLVDKKQSWFFGSSKYRISPGKFELPIENGSAPITVEKSVGIEPPVQPKSLVRDHDMTVNFTPTVDEDYVQWGHFRDVAKIVKSKQFFPLFITGLSGNGKTFMVEQVCAKLKREMVRVNITIETDEDDLLGGFRLVDGETQFHKGPVVEAMERGAVLLLDEVDLASNKILALQPVLEGKGVFLKKINKWVEPTEGFTIIATANTKGKGSESGHFVGTNILNEAFLERFAITMEQPYPTIATETKILKRKCEDEEFVTHLTNWSDMIRQTYYDGGVDEIISTRRLVHIVNTFNIFNDRQKSIQLCISRFDDETKESFLDLYSKVDEKIQQDEKLQTEGVSEDLAPRRMDDSYDQYGDSASPF
tara:strand:- start:4193 stop:5395 length:1203 start_codon:yes stop_codon:yes gene_type:complete